MPARIAERYARRVNEYRPLARVGPGTVLAGTVVLLNSYRMRPAGSPDLRRGRSVSGDVPVTAVTDIFDLGVDIYFALTGRRQQRVDPIRPYRPPSWERPRGARGQPPPPLVPVDVQSVVDRAVADRPEDRWLPTAALAEAARGALDRLPSS